jgi:hypothetical protein
MAGHTGVIGSDRIERLLRSPALMTSIVLLGVALRVWAYASNSSLYLDEILLTRNILDLPVSHLLTQPPLLDQVSPRGFLLVERLAVMIFGQGELALRLFPFVCAVVSVILFRRLAERVLTGAGPALSLLLFAIGVPFIRFAADVKTARSRCCSGHRLAAAGARYAGTRGLDKTFTAIRYRRFRGCVVLTGVCADDGWTGLRPCLGLVDLARSKNHAPARHNNPAVGSGLWRRATRGTSEHDSHHPPVHARFLGRGGSCPYRCACPRPSAGFGIDGHRCFRIRRCCAIAGRRFLSWLH